MTRSLILFIYGLCISIQLHAQKLRLKNIGDYLGDFDTLNVRNTFKIGHISFASDADENFYLNDSIFIARSEDTVMTLEVYKDRYLFVSYELRKGNLYLPEAIEEKRKVRVYDLKNIENYWDFDFLGYNSVSLRRFKPKKGTIKLVKKYLCHAEDRTKISHNR